MIPYLYVEGVFGPSTPIISSGPRGVQFVWEPDKGVHVHRFASLGDYRARAREIVTEETVWKILSDVDDPGTPANLEEATAAELLKLAQENQALRAENDALRAAATAQTTAAGTVTVMRGDQEISYQAKAASPAKSSPPKARARA